MRSSRPGMRSPYFSTTSIFHNRPFPWSSVISAYLRRPWYPLSPSTPSLRNRRIKGSFICKSNRGYRRWGRTNCNRCWWSMEISKDDISHDAKLVMPIWTLWKYLYEILTQESETYFASEPRCLELYSCQMPGFPKTETSTAYSRWESWEVIHVQWAE